MVSLEKYSLAVCSQLFQRHVELGGGEEERWVLTLFAELFKKKFKLFSSYFQLFSSYFLGMWS